MIRDLPEEIEGNIFLVRGERNGQFPFCHTILITGDVRVLIDPGCGIEALRSLQDDFTPDMVVYSHAHPDHCSGCGVFPPEILWGPEQWKESTGNLRLMAERFIREDYWEEWISYMKEKAGFREFRPSHFFDEVHPFSLGGITLEPVHVPGHTDDHYCFYIPEQKIMLSTDIDFSSFGPWYANPESDIDRFIASIRKVRDYDIRTLVSPHRGVIREGIGEAFEAFLGVFKAREDRILSFLNKPRSLEDFEDAALIYGRYPTRGRVLRFWERQMIEKHLGRLFASGIISQEKGGRFRLRETS
ncbi:MAG: MBL fold metallo-hydrolase [Deltaproteobacteria bacterium]|nr:MBL fold metallo-hydrolase [Deltaproteobacteria bacterium]